MRADLLESASSSRNTLARNHSEGTPPTRARNFSEGMIKRFPNTQKMVRRQPRLDGQDVTSPAQFKNTPKLVSLDEGEGRRQIESMLTLRAHNKKYLSRSMDGLLKVNLLYVCMLWIWHVNNSLSRGGICKMILSRPSINNHCILHLKATLHWEHVACNSNEYDKNFSLLMVY